MQNFTKVKILGADVSGDNVTYNVQCTGAHFTELHGDALDKLGQNQEYDVASIKENRDANGNINLVTVVLTNGAELHGTITSGYLDRSL